MSTLYELDAEFRRVMAEAEAEAAEHEGEIPADLAERLNRVSMDRDRKLANCIGYEKSEEAWAEALDNEMAALKARRDRHQANAKWMREYLAACIGEGNKFRCVKGYVYWHPSKRVIVDIPVEQLPEEYQKVECTPKLSVIAADMTAGRNVAGCRFQESKSIVVR